MIVRDDGAEFFIFDCHVHLGDSSFVQRYFPGREGFSGDWWVDVMDAEGVDKCVVFPVMNPHTDYERDNTRVLEWSAAHPDRIVPFMRLQPYFEQEAVADVARYAALGSRGIKLHSRADGGFAVNDPILVKPIIEEASKHDLIVLFHTGEMHFASPSLLWDLALDFPSVNFICGHMGLGDGFADAIAMARRVDNVWLDTTLAWPPNLVKQAADAVGAEKILYGSDSPYISIEAEVSKIMKYAGLPDPAIRRILGENLAELLGVSVAPTGARAEAARPLRAKS